MRPLIERYAVDRDTLQRRYRVPMSPLRAERMRVFYSSWLQDTGAVDFEKLTGDGAWS